MDHLPPVLEPYEVLEIPFLGGGWDPSDDVGCSDLDLSMLSQEMIGGNTSHENPPSIETRIEVAAKVQARLFFGMLYGVLQMEIQMSDFLERDDTILTTRNLREYLHNWKASHDVLRNGSPLSPSKNAVFDDGVPPHSSAVQLEARREKAEKTLNDAYDVWCAFDALGLANADLVDRERFSRVHLSIQVLGGALEHAIQSVSGNGQDDDYVPWVDSFSVPWRRAKSNAYLTSRMLRQGWCPSVITSLSSAGGVAYMYFVSILGRPDRDGHSEAGCSTVEGCKLLNIAARDYQTKHVATGCECEFLGPTEAEMNKLRGIVDDDGIPLLYVDENGDMMVERYQRGIDYTAISHVWADGLGNPTSNSLPTCQIKRLLGLVCDMPWRTICQENEELAENDSVWKRKVSYTLEKEDPNRKRIYLWIDPICVPLKPYPTKLKAIANMRAVYGRANRVLVLDNDLLQTKVRAVDDNVDLRPDIYSKIIASSWARRYWTLQEAALAKKVWYQFKEQAVALHTWGEYVTSRKLRESAEAIEQLKGDEKTAFINELLSPKSLRKDNLWFKDEYLFNDQITWVCTQFDYRFDPAPHDALRFYHVSDRLGSRGCSRPEDRPLCMAILLDKPLEPLLRTDCASERTAILWESLEAVSVGILTLPCEKRTEPHLRWAPLRLDQHITIPTPISHPAHIEAKGARLRFNMHGWTGRMPARFRPRSVIPVNFDGNIYYIRNNINKNNERWVTEDSEGQVVKINIDFSSVQEIGVILGQNPLEHGQSIPQFKGALGALVSVKRWDGHALVVRYLGAVSVIGKNSMFDRHPSWPWSDREKDEKKLENVMSVTATATSQEWLVEGD